MNLIYNLLIQPLVMIYDVLFTLIYGLLENPVPSIIVLSIVINFIVLPLYKKADALQKAEQEKQKKMKPWIDHIRKHFSGDERFMIQSAYYKIEHYSPLSALKEAGPLFLQIPFFIAAYRYISTLPILEGASFGPIQDLLKPDGLITVGGFTVNILPILMTVINIVSGTIYSKGGPVRQRIQIYGTALIFLVLLYNSPSGLVIYWTMNNLFSLGKNIYFAHEPKNKRLLPTVISVLIIPLLSLGMIIGSIDSATDVFLSECILACCFFTIVITILQLYHVRMPDGFHRLLSIGDTGKLNFLHFLLPELVLSLLLGFYIPSSVISSSPVEFMDAATGLFQYELLSYLISVYLGLFLVWTNVIILSRDGRKRTILIGLLWCMAGIAIVNQFLFPPNTGTLYSDLSFDGKLRFPFWRIALNILCCLLACGVLWLLYSQKRRVLLSIGAILSTSLLALSLINCHAIAQTINTVVQRQSEPATENSPITLSKTGRNVIVMMLDRAIGAYVPYIFDELPELKNSYQGFVFYPNTISFGTHTNFGTPGLFGGYEYTPYESNKRDTVSLKDKQNEALKLMPTLFSENGFDVTVCDPPDANYQFIPDLSIYNDLPSVHTYNLNGKFSSRYKTMLSGDPAVRQRHNFLLYSVFRTSPMFLKNLIYNNGNYLSIEKRIGYTPRMIDAYSVMAYLTDITTINDIDKDYFLMFQNETPHNPTPLDPPEYKVDGKTNEMAEYTNRILNGITMKISNYSDWGHYCINVATYKAIAKWLKFLKDEHVYDNTRIILVADHGYYLGQFEDMKHPDGLDIESLNPLLMVKDFDAEGEWTICDDFMTNADVPSLAMQNVIANPVNPFTGISIDCEPKRNTLIVTDSDNWQVEVNNGTTFDLDGGNWWSVHDSIFDMNNWKKLEE